MDRKLQRHRADSLRQHGFLVLFCEHNKCKCSYFWTRKRLFYPHYICGPWHQNKWSVLSGRTGCAAETGDAARYPCNFWWLHFSAGHCTHWPTRPVTVRRSCSVGQSGAKRHRWHGRPVAFSTSCLCPCKRGTFWTVIFITCIWTLSKMTFVCHYLSWMYCFNI